MERLTESGGKFLISFLGTFSTGKTTLVKALGRELKRYGTVEMVFGGTRLVRHHGIKISEKARIPDQSVLTLCTIEKLLGSCADFVLVDEHLLLHVAYCTALGFESWFLKRLWGLVEGVYSALDAKGYSVLNFLLPLIPLQRSKYRSVSRKFRLKVQENLERLVLLDRFRFYRISGYSVKERGTAVDDRVGQVLSVILSHQVGRR